MSPLARIAAVYRALSPPDFWEMTRNSEGILQDYVQLLLDAAAIHFESAKFTDIASTMNHIVSATVVFRDSIKGHLDNHHITLGDLTERLEAIFMAIANDLQKAPGHVERAEMVDKVLDDTALELVKLTARYGIDEEVVSTYLLALKPHIHTLIAIVGDINEQHPQFFPILIFSIAVLLLPEAWILRPFLSLFGFGPAGPVKGSAAAWLQSHFWGAVVEPGSWFSLLQAAGMGAVPEWVGLVTKVSLLAGGLLPMLLPSSNRR